MSEFPNYSNQLMHQLWTMRNEGRFCDCTVVVEGVAYQAHKVVLAASSTLLRSYLISEDTIAINSDTVTSQEFSCLLDMIYTGKLPPGKHHISRIIAAADRLQMYDVAVSFKNLLTTILNQPQIPVIEASSATENNKAQSPSPESSSSPSGDSSHLSSDKTETMVRQRTESCQNGNEDRGEPASKRRRAVLCESSEHENPKSSESIDKEDCVTAAELSTGPATALLERLSQVVELLSSMSSILDLLTQTAQTSLDAQDRQIVCRCCEEADPSSALRQLMSTVKEGQLGKTALLKLLRAVQQKDPAPFPTALLGLLEELEDNRQEPGGGQTGADSETQNGTRENEENKEEKRAVDVATDTSSLSKAPSPSNPSKPYDCRWCKKSFAYKCRMVAHVRRCPMSEEEEQQCPDCPAKLPSQHALQTHRAEAHRSTTRVKPKVACDLCGRTFAHPSGMIYHKRTEHFEEKPFVCDECGAKFGANSSLKNHMRLHTGEKPYHCKHCDMSFSVAAALAYHTKKKHSEGKMYGCQYCKAVFAQSIELTRHVRTHTGDRPYVCRECGKGYSQASGLTAHLHTFHNLAEPHDCQKCCLSFSSLEEHRQHIQEFHSKNCHKCLICSKLFTSAALLEKHRATHTGNRPFTCDLCNKSYLHLSGLWYHNRTTHPDVFASHTRQFQMLVQCDICFKFCPNAASLAKHHAAEHQGPSGRAVQCPFCPCMLAGGEELEEHITDQHSSQVGEAFCCSLCSLLCSSQQELQGHVLSLHMGVLEEQDAEQEEPSTSHTVIAAEAVGEARTESIFSEQQVIVALAGTNDGESPGEVVEVNMYDLLNSSVTFVCEDQPQS